MRVMDLPHWPPDSGGPFKAGDVFPVSAESVIIENVVRVDGEKITFTCTFNGKLQSYDFSAPDEKIAAKLAVILKDNVGKTLFSVGMIEIPGDGKEAWQDWR